MPGKIALRLAALLLAAALAPAGTAAATLPAEASLSTRLARALDRQHLPASGTAALALDLDDGTVAFQRNAAVPLRPASNEKLPLGVWRRSTSSGPASGSRRSCSATAHATGAPGAAISCSRATAIRACTPTTWPRSPREIRALGIRRVTGRVLGDESFFDTRRTAPGWKSSYYKHECPPLSALVVDRAWLDGRMSRRAGARRRDRLSPGACPAGR